MKTQSVTADGWQLQGNSAQAYERYLATAFSPWAEALVALADAKNGDRVLDVACGTGIVARHAARRVGSAGTVVGIDLNDGMLEVARTAAAGVQPPIEFRHGNASSLPLPAGAFDVVFCEQAIQFFPDPVTAIGEMRRVLTPRGRAAVSVCRPIAFSPAYVAMARALDRYVGPEAGAVMRSPFCTWDVGQLRSLFLQGGFRDVRVRIDVCSLRYPSCEQFLFQEAASSPLAALVGVLDEAVRTDLIAALETALADHVDDAGVVCPIEIYVVLAHP